MFLILVGGGVVHIHNDLVSSGEEVTRAWAQLENVRQRRADLIPGVAAVAVAHAEHERALLTALAEALSAAPGPWGPERVDLVRDRERVLVRARTAIEHNPRLSSAAAWATLRHEVVGSENRILIERRRYNDAVRVHRTRLRTLPGRLLGPLLGFTLPPEY